MLVQALHQASAHLLCSGGGGRPPQIFSGGGLFNSRGGLFRSNFIPKNHNFSDDFPVLFVVYSYDVASLNDTNEGQECEHNILP